MNVSSQITNHYDHKNFFLDIPMDIAIEGSSFFPNIPMDIAIEGPFSWYPNGYCYSAILHTLQTIPQNISALFDMIWFAISCDICNISKYEKKPRFQDPFKKKPMTQESKILPNYVKSLKISEDNIVISWLHISHMIKLLHHFSLCHWLLELTGS